MIITDMTEQAEDAEATRAISLDFIASALDELASAVQVIQGQTAEAAVELTAHVKHDSPITANTLARHLTAMTQNLTACASTCTDMLDELLKGEAAVTAKVLQENMNANKAPN